MIAWAQAFTSAALRVEPSEKVRSGQLKVCSRHELVGRRVHWAVRVQDARA